MRRKSFYLVEKNISFRDAHEIVGLLVHHCIKEGKYLDELDLETYKKFSPVFNQDIYEYLKIENAVKQRKS